jgi:hypothetical protein
MPTFSPEQVLARPTGRAPLWEKAAGRRAVAAGRSVYSGLARCRAALAV